MIEAKEFVMYQARFSRSIFRVVKILGLLLLTGQFLVACGGTDDSDDSGLGDGSDIINNAPIANAGSGQNVSTGTQVSLSASNSFDADGDSLSYNWTFSSLPIGSGASLANATTVNPSFTPDIDGDYFISLVVNDGTVDSNIDKVIITASGNNAPVANAGTDQMILTGSQVVLDASNSSDADGDSLIYNWSFSSVPTGSNAVLENAATISASFTADIDGDYIIALIVSDGAENSSADSVTVSSSTTLNSLQGYTLFSPMQSTETYLIDELGNTVHTWQSDYRPGLSVYLLDNGELLRTGAINNKPTTFAGSYGGSAGIIEILDWNSNVIWSKSLATEEYFSHHDVEQLPNGNILAIVWEAKTAAQALALGRSNVSDDSLWADAIYEICRASTTNNCIDGEIIWQWNTWQHVVQDDDSSISETYVTNVNEHSDKIDLNFFKGSGGADWTHINSVDYNADTDQILVSVHGFSEYWIIDHSDANRGIIGRVGNPSAYGEAGEQVLFSQHDAQWIDDSAPGAGNILVFNNGQNRPEGNYSSVDEFCYSEINCVQGELVASYYEGPTGDFYANHISGAQRLTNGNTLVCEGTKGRLFEYDTNHDVVWEFIYDSQIFKVSRYLEDYSGLQQLK